VKNPPINFLSAIIILLMLSFQLQAKEISAPSNPKKYSESIKAITLKIIDNKPTDDAKLEAIHDWIIYRIEYNVEKFLTNDFSTVSNVEVVKYRQAVCTGYASLMDEMCYWAGIKCVTINGYAKTENVDLGDKFYVASHCWNAVQLGNQWYFVDATWDAGYIQYTKHLFLSKKVKFSPRFVAAPNKNYFKKSASDFMKDHLPLNSNWQLTDKKMSIKKFEKDSSAYLGVNHFSNSAGLPSADNQNYLLNYAAENNWEQTIDDGKDGFAFNGKNFICKAEQYAAKMNLLKEDLKADKELIAADTAALNEISKNAKFAADTFLLMKNKLGEMKNELMNNNKLKGKIISSENGELLSINKKIVSSINRTQKKLKTQSKANKLLMKQNDKNVDQFLSSLNFYKTTFSKNAKAEDTLGLEEKIDKLKDSVKIATDEYLKLTQSFNDLYDADITKLERYDELTKKGITDLKQAMDMRQQMVDDLDFPIQTLKTKFIKRQNMADELLLNGKIFFTDSLFKLFKQIQLQHIKVVNYQKHILKLDKKMRKYKAESTAQIQIYLDAMSGMETFVYRHKDFIRKFSSKGKLMNKQFKKRLTTNKQENKHLQSELQLEKMLNKARGRMILKQNTGYNKFCKSQASACLKQIKLDNRLKVKAAKK
jgi:hypothetical protein